MRVDPFAPAGHPAHPSQNATTASVESDVDANVSATEEVTPIGRGRKGRGRRKTHSGDTATAVDTDR